MRKMRGVTILLVVVGLLLIGASPALADGPPNDGTTVFNHDFTVEDDESIEGDLVVFNGDASIEEGGWVEGSLIVWNGDAEVEGTVEGDLVVTNGKILLASEARIEGDVVCSHNCQVERAEGARVDGAVVEGLPIPSFRIPQIPRLDLDGDEEIIIKPPRLALGHQLIGGFTRLAKRLLVVALLVVIAGVVALIWPQQTDRMAATVFAHPGPTLGIGLLTGLAALTIILLLAITICLSLASALLAFALVAVAIFGWSAIGLLIGRRLMVALRVKETALPWATALGALVITLILAGLGMTPCLGWVGWLATLLLASMGLGAVVLTRFGTKRYSPGSAGRGHLAANTDGAGGIETETAHDPAADGAEDEDAQAEEKDDA